jgi:hypothetical protein
VAIGERADLCLSDFSAVLALERTHTSDARRAAHDTSQRSCGLFALLAVVPLPVCHSVISARHLSGEITGGMFTETAKRSKQETASSFFLN